MATITPQVSSSQGVNLTWSSAVVAGDQLLNTVGSARLFFRNASAGSIVITATSQKTIVGLDIEDPAYTLAAGADGEMGPFDPTIFNTSAGAVELTYSGASVTGLQIAAVS